MGGRTQGRRYNNTLRIRDTIEIINLRTKDKFQCTKNGDFPYTLLTSDKGQPLNKGQNSHKKKNPNVAVIRTLIILLSKLIEVGPC